MIKTQLVKSGSSYAPYSLPKFTQECAALAGKITALGDKIFKAESGRIRFETELDSVTFNQMNLAARIKTLPSKDLGAARAMMVTLEKSLTVLDKALYSYDIPKKNFSDVLIKSFCSGFVSGVIRQMSTPIENAVMPTYAQYQESLFAGHYAQLEAGAIDTSVPEFMREYDYDSAGMGWGENKPLFRDIYVDPSLSPDYRAGEYGENALKLLRHAGNEFGHGNVGNAIGTVGDAAIQAGHSIPEIIKTYLEYADNQPFPPPLGGAIPYSLGEK